MELAEVPAGVGRRELAFTALSHQVPGLPLSVLLLMDFPSHALWVTQRKALFHHNGLAVKIFI